MTAWEAVPGVGKPFFGPNSGGFDLLEYYSDLSLGDEVGELGTNAFKIAAGASHRASAAGPETIFSRAGLMCTALRSGLSTGT